MLKYLTGLRKKVHACVQTREGFYISKKDTEKSVLEDIRKELTLYPLLGSKYASEYVTKKTKIPVYRETPNYLKVPRAYAYGELDIQNEVKYLTPKSKLPPIPFRGELRENQVKIVEDTLSVLRNPKKGGGTMELHCGFGKTTCALYMVSQLQVKTIVVVHQENLMDQWKERIRQFLPSARIGIIQGQVVDIDQKDVVLAMLKTISMKEYQGKNVYDFDFVIVDECDKISSQLYSNSIYRFESCSYRLGLSATPYRLDGLEKVFLWSLGPILVSKKAEYTKCIVKLYKYYETEGRYLEHKTNQRGKEIVSIPKMMAQVTGNKNRLSFIVSLLCSIVKDTERKILLLSQYRELLTDLETELNRKNVSCGLYYGGMSSKAKEESARKQIILGTFSMASVGLDIPGLNTLFLATSKPGKRKDQYGKYIQGPMEQTIGRIFRGTSSVERWIVDIADQFSVFANQSRTRVQFYRENGFEIQMNIEKETLQRNEVSSNEKEEKETCDLLDNFDF